MLVIQWKYVLILMCRLQPKMTPQERLKLRMQKALNKQCEYNWTLVSPIKNTSLWTWLYFAGKADKKAAQAKIQQQEHKRQVCFYCSRHLFVSWPDNNVGSGALFLPSTVFVLQEREGELRAMARKIRMK